jgi:tetratricopeptide (TPR) repeat protein
MSFLVRLLPVVLTLVTLAACGSPEAKVAAHVKKARELIAQDSFDKAKLEAKNALQLDPKSAEAHLILAKVAWREQNVREAFPHLQMAVEGDPKLLEARLRLGDLFAASGDAKGAAEQVEAVRKLDPENPELHLLAGKVLVLQGDNKGGIAEIDKALAARPGFSDAILSKASVLNAEGDRDGAMAVLNDGLTKTKGTDTEAVQDFRLRFLLATGQEETYEKDLLALIRQQPDKLKYRYQLLDLYSARDRRDDQERMLRELVDVDPKNHLIKVRLAGFLVNNRNDMAGAEKLLKDSIAAYPDSAELRVGLGDYYRFVKRAPDAMAAYREVANQWPASTAEGQQARNRIVTQHVRDGEIAKAQAELAEILKVAPDNSEALIARATFSFLDRKYEDAIADLRTALRRQRSLDASLLLARSYLGIGDVVVAKDTYRRILDDYPGNAVASRELAVLLSDQGEAAAAEEVLRRYTAVRPDDTVGSLNLINSLLARNDLGAAEAEARRLIKEGRGEVGQAQLGRVMMARGSNDEALAIYKAALEKDPNQARALDGLVNVLLAMNRSEEAINYLERYPKGDVLASVLLGRVYVRQGDIASARQVVTQALEQHPEDSRVYIALASLAESDSPEQVSVLERGWKANPGDPLTGLFLASIAQREGNFEQAIGIYEEVLKKVPNDLIITNNLASLLLDHRSDKESLARALNLAKPLAGANEAATIDTVGWAYYRNGDYANAVRHLERAVALNGEDALLLYHLGKAYAGAGNRESARQYLADAVEKGAGQPFLADARASLAKLGS